MENPELPWMWFIVSKTKDISAMSDEKIQKIAREYFAKKKIARYLRECISNPEYKVCRDRLNREFQELI